MAGAVIQATGRAELEDGTRTGVRLKRLNAHCGVYTGPTVMLNPLWGWHGSGGGVGAIILMLKYSPRMTCQLALFYHIKK